MVGASVVGSGLTPGPVPPESGERPPSVRCSSIGKANTAAGPSTPRKRSVRAAMACSSTNSIDSSTSPLSPSASSTSLARRTQRIVSTGSSFCSSAAKTSIAMSGRGAGLLVRVDDVLDDLVSHHVACTQVDEPQAVDPTEHLVETDQTAAAARHVDLRDVARDHGLRSETDAREEHLHLLGRGVLGLVEDDEAVIEGTATHECEGRHLDGPSLEKALGPLRFEHVVQRVIERTEVGVDLGHEVAGQEAQPLPCLDGRTG